MPVIIYDGENITAKRDRYHNTIALFHGDDQIAKIGNDYTPGSDIVDAIRKRTNWGTGVVVTVDQISDLIIQWNFYDFYGSPDSKNITIVVPRPLIDQFAVMVDGYHDFTPPRFGEYVPDLLFRKNDEGTIDIRDISNGNTFIFNQGAFAKAVKSDDDGMIKAESGQHLVIANESHYVMGNQFEDVKVIELVYVTNDGPKAIRHILNEAEINFIKGDN